MGSRTLNRSPCSRQFLSRKVNVSDGNPLVSLWQKVFVVVPLPPVWVTLFRYTAVKLEKAGLFVLIMEWNNFLVLLVPFWPTRW